MKLDYLFKVLLYVVAGVMVFLFSKLHREFVQSHSCTTTTSNAVSTTAQEPQSIIATSTPQVTCPPRRKKATTKKASANNKPQSLSIDVLRYLQGEKDQQKRKKLKRSKQSKTKQEENFRVYGEEAVVLPRVLDSVLSMYHHPSSPMTSEILLRPYPPAHQAHLEMMEEEPYESCQHVYLTRTGSLANMPNKCLSVVLLPERFVNMRFPKLNAEKEGDEVSLFIPHYRRLGKISGLVNMYQQDYVDSGALRSESVLIPSILEHMAELTDKIHGLMGDPLVVDETKTKRRSVIVMVLNEGVMDVFINFLCSLRSANIYDEVVPHIIGFVGQENMVEVVEALGVKAFFSVHMGVIPAKAAGTYGDMTFARMMWLKATSVYLASHAGYHVLFQDVDLVWMVDPLPLLEEMEEQDVIFMDDGARTPRFTPFYFNSGFYYIRHTAPSLYLMHRMLNSIGEISVTHSHQSVLTHYVHESVDLALLSFSVLPKEMYPSGYLYHHEKEYISDMLNYKILPKVFHMCWTESRVQKVEYFKNVGLWFLRPDNSTCYSSPDILTRMQTLQSSAPQDRRSELMDQCCLLSDYWTKRKQHFSSQEQQQES